MRAALLLGLSLAGMAILRDQPAAAQETKFTPRMSAGQHLALSNIDGDVFVTRAEGSTAEIVAIKSVRRGDGSRVKAILEETDDGYRVCTIYLHRGERDRNTCRGDGGHRGDWSDDSWDVDMRYEVRLPSGVFVDVNTVDGNVEILRSDAAASVHTVDGSIHLEGVAPRRLNTVDGDISAVISNSTWNADVTISSVDGDIDLTLPAGIALNVSGTTVDGDVRSDFPITMRGKWGPQSFSGSIGGGSSRSLRLSSVDGSITLRKR